MTETVKCKKTFSKNTEWACKELKFIKGSWYKINFSPEACYFDVYLEKDGNTHSDKVKFPWAFSEEHFEIPEEVKRNRDDKFAAFYEFSRSWKRNFLDLRSLEGTWKIFKESKGWKPEKNGTYKTIRAGLSGIYSMLNEWKDGDWLCRVADASYTIYFDPEPINMKQFGYE